MSAIGGSLGVANGVIGNVELSDIGGLATFGVATSTNYSIGGDLTVGAEGVVVAANAAVIAGGNLALTGTGRTGSGAGVEVAVVDGGNTSLAVTGSSTLTLNGTGGSVSSASNDGVELGSQTSTGRVRIQSEAGNITILGNGSDATGTSQTAGVQIGATTIETLAGGHINITGVAPTAATGEDADGVVIENESNILNNVATVGTGSITIIGTAFVGGEAIDMNDGTPNKSVIRSGSGG
ncbi:MAG: hypothetical protein EBU59_08475, partial [Planctomycetia bacterium]|nr:hypothetical protein [Planctomycetia bacterium]